MSSAASKPLEKDAMANNLTGDYDSVVQLRPRGVNRILAALHRKGRPTPAADSPGIHLQHSGSLNFPLATGGVASTLRGHLQFQVSTPLFGVPIGSDGSRVSIIVEFYSWFQKVSGSEPAPEFAHGALTITAGVRLVSCGGETLVEVDLRNANVAFAPASGSGLSAEDGARVLEIATDVVRHGFQPVQVRVSALGEGDLGVRDFAFKTHRSGTTEALSLLLTLAVRPGANPNPGQVNQAFVDASEDVAMAVGREFLTDLLLTKAREAVGEIQVSGSQSFLLFTLSFSASVDPNSLQLRLEADRLVAVVEGSGSTTLGGFGFRLTTRFGLGVRNGNPALSLPEDPGLEITRGNFVLKGILGLFKGRIVSAIKGAMLASIADLNRELDRLADDSLSGLLDRFSLPGVQLRLARASISPDAIVLAGNFRIGAAPPVVASFTNQTVPPSTLSAFGARIELNALESWIPGGTVRLYRWLEVRGDGSVERQIDDRHRFLLRALRDDLIADATPGAGGGTTTTPPGRPGTGLVANPNPNTIFAWPPYSWCLEVHGDQIVSSGSGVAPVSGKVCGMTTLVLSVDLSRAARLTVRVPDGKGGVLADLDPWGGYRSHAFAGDQESRGLLLVHHASKQGLADSVRALTELLAKPVARDAVFPTVIVERSGEGCRLPSRELAHLTYTHDPEGAWRARFGLDRPDTTVLVGPGGKELWRGSGALRVDELSKVVAAHRPDTVRPPRTLQVRPAVALGVRAPDFQVPCFPGDLVLTAMRKFRGREVKIVFWTTWSDPSLEELRRAGTESGSRGAADGAPMVLLVNDGEDPELARRKLKELGLGFPMVPDPDRAIARRYGIVAWPTVVQVDREGRVAEIRLGLEPPAKFPPLAPDPSSQETAPYQTG
jgi:hypothetical protein